MDTITFQVEQEENGGFVAEAYIAENEHIVTQGDTIEELKLMIRDALECHFGDNNKIPSFIILLLNHQNNSKQ